MDFNDITLPSFDDEMQKHKCQAIINKIIADMVPEDWPDSNTPPISFIPDEDNPSLYTLSFHWSLVRPMTFSFQFFMVLVNDYLELMETAGLILKLPDGLLFRTFTDDNRNSVIVNIPSEFGDEYAFIQCCRILVFLITVCNTEKIILNFIVSDEPGTLQSVVTIPESLMVYQTPERMLELTNKITLTIKNIKPDSYQEILSRIGVNSRCWPPVLKLTNVNKKAV